MIFVKSMYEITQFFGLLFLSFLLGSLATLLLFSFLFYKYLKFSSSVIKKSEQRDADFKKVVFSDLLKKNLNLKSTKASESVESCRFLNILLSFILKEWRDTAQVHRWVVKKINVEIEELLETKAARRLLHGIKIHDVNLGPNTPVIHGMSVKEPCSLTSENLPDKIVIDIDIEYNGGFSLAVDVDLVFGKSAFVSININHMKGLVRLQMNRHPCTHWSVSFVEEPVLSVKIDTSFESMPLPQLGSLILSQMQRIIKRKHTYPKCKLRYTPFNAFWIDKDKFADEDDFVAEFTKVEVTIVSCTRLMMPSNLKKKPGTCGVIFATLSIDEESCEGLEAVVIETAENKKTPVHSIPVVDESLKESDAEEEPSDPVSVSDEKEGSVETSPKKEKEENELKPVIHSKSEPDMANGFEKKEKSKSFSYIEKSLSKITEKKETKKNKSSLNNTSYMMITRNFTALLSERAFVKPDGSSQIHVYVGAITLNKALSDKASISEGDRILSINGTEIKSLSQAIAVIKEIRQQKDRFYFKVQRNRQSRTSSMKNTRSSSMNQSSSMEDTKPGRSLSFGATSTSDDESEEGEDDTESDFSEIDSDDYEQFISEEQALSKAERELNEALQKSSETPDDPSQGATSIEAETLSLPNKLSGIIDEDDLEFARITPASTGAVLRTSFCDAELSEYEWSKDLHSLPVSPEHKYLNVRFWYQEVPTTARKHREKLLLLGNLSIPLKSVYQNCSLMASKRFTRRYKVTSPLSPFNVQRWSLDESFKQKTGFRREHCYGDATITTKIFDLI